MTSTSLPAASNARGADRTPSLVPLVSLGRIGAVASVLGAIGAGVLLVVAADPMVGDGRFSYPLDATWYSVAQVCFAVQHVAMLPLFAGLLLLERERRSRGVRIGVWVAVVGQLVLTVDELFALTARRSMSTGSTADAVNASYGPAMMLIGIGLLVAGVGFARGRTLDGWARWVPLALGGYVFLVLFPAVFGPMVAGRIAIGVWMLMFAALGLALVSRGRGAAGP